MQPEKDHKNYRWGFFYHNPSDERLFLPKPNPSMGIQLNFGRRKAWIFLVGFLAFVGFVIFMIERNH